MNEPSDRPAGGPLTGYLRRGFAENPRGVGALIAGIAIGAVGAVAQALDAFFAGLALFAVMLAISIVAALLERRADIRSGRPFSMTRPTLEGPSTTANQDLEQLRGRRQRVEADIAALRDDHVP